MQGNILDLLLTNSPEHIVSVKVDSGGAPLETDHYAVHFGIIGHIDRDRSRENSREVYNFSKTDMEGLSDYISWNKTSAVTWMWRMLKLCGYASVASSWKRCILSPLLSN